MPHGLRIDHTATEALRLNGLFEDRGSFISLPDLSRVTHVHLEGKDRSAQRHRLYVKSKGKCAICRRWSPENEEMQHRMLGPAPGEMHHPGNCDCLSKKCPNRVEWRCSQWQSNCHVHRKTGFKRHATQESVPCQQPEPPS